MSTNELKLEWHESKRQKAMRERGLDFGMAQAIFADPNSKEYVDDRFDYGENRRRIYGLCFDACMCITYTIRNGAYRIISIRRVHEKERKIYYD
ncbi:MAG: BrnT family toxin [Chitinispirillales bacterium]|jgi:uncharacterized DUF497 family protein|nr:BrnT family toxin [Chitinispirillales bacterium]